MQSKWWGWLAMIGAGAVVWCTYCTDPAAPPPSSALVDALRAVNAQMVQRAEALGRATETLVQQRDQARQQWAVTQRTSDSVTAQLRRLRDSLPSADNAAAADLPRLYASALTQLDQAHAALTRKDSIIQAAGRDRVQSDSIEAAWRTRATLYQGLYGNEQAVSAEWEQRYGQVLARQPRCQRKCGIVVGVLVTVGTAIAIDQVHQALNPQR